MPCMAPDFPAIDSINIPEVAVEDIRRGCRRVENMSGEESRGGEGRGGAGRFVAKMVQIGFLRSREE